LFRELLQLIHEWAGRDSIVNSGFENGLTVSQDYQDGSSAAHTGRFSARASSTVVAWRGGHDLLAPPGAISMTLERRARIEPGATRPDGRPHSSMRNWSRCRCGDDLRPIGVTRTGGRRGRRNDVSGDVGVSTFRRDPPVSGSSSVRWMVRSRSGRPSTHRRSGDREAAGLARTVSERQPRDLHRILGRDELQKLEVMPWRCARSGCSLARAGRCTGRRLRNRLGGGLHSAPSLIADVDRLARRVADRSVGPRVSWSRGY